MVSLNQSTIGRGVTCVTPPKGECHVLSRSGRPDMAGQMSRLSRYVTLVLQGRWLPIPREVLQSRCSGRAACASPTLRQPLSAVSCHDRRLPVRRCRGTRRAWRSVPPPYRAEILGVCDATATFPQHQPQQRPSARPARSLSAREVATPPPTFVDGSKSMPGLEFAITASPRRWHRRCFSDRNSSTPENFSKPCWIIRPPAQPFGRLRQLAVRCHPIAPSNCLRRARGYSVRKSEGGKCR